MDTTVTTVFESPWGYIGLAATAAGVTRVVLPCPEAREAGARLPAAIDGLGVEEASRIVEAAERQILEYFAGRQRTFDFPVALPPATPFTRAVWRACATIPFGEVRTYRALAASIDRGGAMRAVGGALGANPLPIIIPCHRVIRTDGTLGGFGGGLPLKRRLLALEGWTVWG